MEIGIKGFKGVRFEAGNFIIKSDAIEIETGKKVIVQAVQKKENRPKADDLGRLAYMTGVADAT